MPWTAPPPKLCTLCISKVYPVEELYTDGTLYHKKCFRCQTCYKVLSLGEYASLRLSPAERGVAIFCKPHFRQNFLEHGRYSELAVANSAPAASPLSSPYRPSGISLFSDDEDAPRPTPPRRKESSKTAKDFESGFAAEYKPTEVKPLGCAQCSLCAKKVFAVCQVKTETGQLFHLDCFRCATCAAQLSVGAFATDGEGALCCLKHAPRA